MHLALSLLAWLLALRTYLDVGVDQPIDAAREQIDGREFWVLQDPARPTVAWREAQDRGAIRYRLLIEVGLEDLWPSWVATVGAVLDDERGWKASGREFVRVDDHEQFSIVLASPATVDRLCKPLRTSGVYSCGRNRRAMLNELRWREGTETWADEVGGYRVYMVNHEVGHLLGMPHRPCHEVGQPAPVMLQQTMRLEGCTVAGWPASFELDSLGKRHAD